MDSYEIVEFSDEYLREVLDLFNAVHYDYMDENLWKWKYSHRERKAPQILMVVSKGKIVGIQPSLVNRINLQNREVYACMLADVMTHPEYRRKGIFSLLIRESMKRSLKKGIPLIYTFPNEQSFPGFIEKLKWHHIFSLPLHVKVLNIQSLADELSNLKAVKSLSHLLAPVQRVLFRKVPLNEKKYDILECQELNEEALSSFLKKSLSDYPLSIIRDKRYLEWRYLNHPKFKYYILLAYKGKDIVGILIFRFGKFKNIKTCFICDFFVDKSFPDTGYSLLKRMEDFVIKKKINVVGCLLLNNKKESKIIKDFGFRIIPSRILGKEFYFILNFDKDLFDINYLQDYSKWFLTWGDSDVV
jgi:GNAT superfamily N-acetyltransferase